MSQDERLRLLKSREYTVTKSNQIVQKSRFELSVQEQKTIAYICSMIKPRSPQEIAVGVPYILEYEFNIRDYCKICGIDYDCGKNYADIKKQLKSLRDKSLWLLQPDNTEATVSWINKVWCNKGSGKAKIRLDEDMIPHLFDLKERFVSYGLYYILGMKSQYSMRIYELLKSYLYKHTVMYDLNDLKHLLMVDNIKSYNRFPDFRRNVLEVAKNEINTLTDIVIDYETITKGRKVIGLKFIISSKGVRERVKSQALIEQMLGDIK